MKVEILKVKDNILINAKILNSKSIKIGLPSMADGWRFNFNKHIKKKNFEIYVLVKDETPNVIEGCLAFEMKEKIEPYMAFLEVAPHNYGKNKEYERVAGCLIAFACRLSFMKVDDIYKGWLAFDILEEKKEDEIKLMTIYSLRYGALKYTDTTMVIPPVGSQKLIEEYLITDYEK